MSLYTAPIYVAFYTVIYMLTCILLKITVITLPCNNFGHSYFTQNTFFSLVKQLKAVVLLGLYCN